MKTQNTKTQFNKHAIVELDNIRLLSINGGSSPVCLPSIIATLSDIL